jgi:L-aspartate oxidase
MAAGDGLCDPRAVEVLVSDGPQYVRELMAFGVQFDRGADAEPALAIEGAHSTRRVLHARDATGREIGRVLWQRASVSAGVRTRAHACVVDLIIEHGECRGACFINRDGEIEEARADFVLLATGGAGQVYRETTNPPVATGDGVAMAYRAGAAVADLEFVQFHPTALKVERQPRFLLSEALRGEGARLINAEGEAFVERYESAGDLASRDRVARAIALEEERSGRPVYLSLQLLDPTYVHERFPLIAQACIRAGLDLARDPIPVGPAAHYVMGGVLADLDGRTTVPRLFAAGEVACTGVHGANRLASNSLLEGLVFGARAAAAMPHRASDPVLRAAHVYPLPPPAAGGVVPGEDELRELMWRDVGLLRTREGLEEAVARLSAWWGGVRQAALREGEHRDVRRVASLVTVGLLMARAALRREESRGAHFRADFPERDIHWKLHVADRL